MCEPVGPHSHPLLALRDHKCTRMLPLHPPFQLCAPMCHPQASTRNRFARPAQPCGHSHAPTRNPRPALCNHGCTCRLSLSPITRQLCAAMCAPASAHSHPLARWTRSHVCTRRLPLYPPARCMLQPRRCTCRSHSDLPGNGYANMVAGPQCPSCRKEEFLATHPLDEIRSDFSLRSQPRVNL